MHDCHTHSVYSEDVDKEKGSTIDGMAQTAISLGLTSLAVTDHLEIDKPDEAPLDSDAVRRDIFAAKEKYAGKLNLIYGVELGQMCHNPRLTKEKKETYNYEFIIGSAHAVRGCPDFSCSELYKQCDDARLLELWNIYLAELAEMVDFGGFDVLAHITYPTRYFKLAGKSGLIDIDVKGRDYFEPILKAIIEKGIALEINTSGLRQNLGITLPGRDLAMFYYELGGRELSFGSDAHYACDIGKGIADAYRMCLDIGFKYVTVCENGVKQHYLLEKELSK